MMRRLLGAAVLVALAPPGAFVLTPAASAAGSAAPTPPSTAVARLQGVFRLAGRITTAVDIRGERPGQDVIRKWTFTPFCRVGQCRRIKLGRTRAGGTDRLVLYRRSPGYYTGRGSFYAPLRCGTHLWHRGAYVPFTITVRITAASLSNGVAVATRIRAFYKNTVRYNQTPCVSVLGHDAARYHGHLVGAGAAGWRGGRGATG